MFLLCLRRFCYILSKVRAISQRNITTRSNGKVWYLDMALLQQWKEVAYNENLGRDKLQQFWHAYFAKETEIYQQLLQNPDEVVKGTVKELAEKYDVSIMTMTGFLDGINDSLVEANPIEEMEEFNQLEEIDKETVNSYMYNNLPPIDLLIRTQNNLELFETHLSTLMSCETRRKELTIYYAENFTKLDHRLNVEYFVELNEEITYTVNSLEGLNPTDLEAMEPFHASFVSGKGVLNTLLPFSSI